MRWPYLASFLLLACPVAPAPTAGSVCNAENIGRCDSMAPRLLQCTIQEDGGGYFRIYADCRGPKGCSVSDDTADCDTAGNSVGDRCPPTSEGKVRCDPDGGINILRCLDGGLDVIFECPQGSRCGFDDAGLTCI